MSTGFFGNQKPIRYEGPESRNPLSYRWYDPARVVLGKTMPPLAGIPQPASRRQQE